MATQAERTSETRSRILDAAGELFYAHGINATGIDAVVAKSGVAKMTLYKHFPSKDVLIAEWLRRQSQRWRANFESSLDRIADSPRRKLDCLFEVLAEWFTDPAFRGCAFVNCVTELADPQHPGRKVCAEHRRLVREYLSRLAFEAGYPNHRDVGESLAMLADGATVAALAESSPESALRARHLAAALLEQRTI
ncbi:MAG: TetR/AcrR family transcriptional regulator [Phycisphaerae bacterium]|nr:TetR/AcrR family transcriptional regulator [Phycisphaerae bacterium]